MTSLQVRGNYPSLKRLKSVSEYLISESTMLHLLNNNSRINLNFISSLTYLILRLLHYFPTQLVRLSIGISEQTMFNWADHAEMKLAPNFLLSITFDSVTAHLRNIETISFKKLKNFIYVNDGQDNDLVLLKYTNGEEQYYYLDEEKRKMLAETPTTPCFTVYCDAYVIH
ncbi:hypothetical protein BDF21DRAFT_451237 [Thamnidium elegans]|nr:hypothetical protein BDF21DRAFT_451237 [Thamnidium elegans]